MEAPVCAVRLAESPSVVPFGGFGGVGLAPTLAMAFKKSYNTNGARHNTKKLAPELS